MKIYYLGRNQRHYEPLMGGAGGGNYTPQYQYGYGGLPPGEGYYFPNATPIYSRPAPRNNIG